MWPIYVLGAATITVVAGIVGFGAWALTRGKDRIQLATLCLLGCATSYVAAVLLAYSQVGTMASVALLAAYTLALYFASLALAIHNSRWAWRVAIVAFPIHVVLALWGAVALTPRSSIELELARTGLSIALAIVGLWACLHRGSRELVAQAATGV